MLKLWCAGKLAAKINGKIERCPSDVNRFRFSCLACRLRRFYYGRYHTPPYNLEYTFRSFAYQIRVGSILYTWYPHLNIDPRGHFTMLRVAFIKVVDSIMLKLKRTKPLIEFAEFAANYPTW